MTIAVANVNQATDTFGQWMAKTSQLADAMSNRVVTVNSNTAVGNASISGTFSANSITISNTGFVSLGKDTSNTVAAPTSIVLQTSIASNNVITSTGMIINGTVQYTENFMTLGTSRVSTANANFNDLYLTNHAQFTNGSTYLTSDKITSNFINTASVVVSSNATIGGSEANVYIGGDGIRVWANPTGFVTVNSFMTSTDLYVQNIHANTMTVSNGIHGDQQILGDLNVTGNYNLDGILTIYSGNVVTDFQIGGNNIVTGTLSTKNEIVHGNSHIIGNLTVNGSATIGGAFTASNGFTITGNQHVTGDLQVDGNITTNLSQHIVGNLEINGYEVLTGSLSVGNGANIAGGAAITGALTATGNITAYYSDDNLKDKLGNIENALEKLISLNGFKYRPNQTAQDLGYPIKDEVGVSAQEVQKVLPEAVVPAPVSDQYLTVHYDRIIPLLIEAIKELKAEVDSLKNDR